MKTGRELVAELRQFNHKESAELMEKLLDQVEAMEAEEDAFFAELEAEMLARAEVECFVGR